jgi:hypothetical protein
MVDRLGGLADTIFDLKKTVLAANGTIPQLSTILIYSRSFCGRN